MRFTLRGARLIDATMDVAKGDLVINGPHIAALDPATQDSGTTIDATNTIVMPGFIEVHTHGGGGFNLHTTDVEEIRSYARWIPQTGVTSFLIAVVGTPHALPDAQLHTAVEAIELSRQHGSGAQPIGIHLEGPYINEKRRGAHPPSWLRTPETGETEYILSLTRGHLKLTTMAPELPHAPEMIKRLQEAGVTVSMGHTDVNFEQARSAIQQGITHVTHCFNAMRPLLHRDPGPVAALAQAETVMGELIADGIHVHPAMMDILVRILGPERTIVVTDAQACAGIPDAVFEFAGQEARVVNGAARLADGTLAGSALTMDQALRNMLDMTGISLSDAVRMLTLNPARSARTDHSKGLLKAGYDADLLIFDESLQLQATICRGQLAYVDQSCPLKLHALQTL